MNGVEPVISMLLLAIAVAAFMYMTYKVIGCDTFFRDDNDDDDDDDDDFEEF